MAALPGQWSALLTRTARRAACGLLCAAVTATATMAVSTVEEASPGAIEAPHWVFFPDDDIYPQYIADPLRPQSAVLLTGFLSSDIPDAGSERFLLRMGGRFSIARRHPEGRPDRGFQIDFEGGFFSQFDMVNSLDNIGWDGLFGLRLSYKGDGPWAFCFGSRHDSAHVGDEYAERTGRQRVGYTREEIVLGASWSPDRHWRTYVETGWAYTRSDSEKAARLQLGLEHVGRKGVFRGNFPWYAAVDTNIFEQEDVQVRVSAQLGVIFPTHRGTNRYRAALEYVTGPSVLGEFGMYDESYLGLGWYFDF